MAFNFTRFIVATTFLWVAISMPVNAQNVVKGKYIGCISESYLDEMTQAMIRKDMNQAMALMNKVCFFIQGKQFSIVDQGFLKSKIRVYAGGSSAVLWVPSEAAR